MRTKTLSTILVWFSLATTAPTAPTATTAAPTAAPTAPVHSMVPLFHRWDYQDSLTRLARVADTGASRVSFTILLLSELEPGFKVKNFGAIWPHPTADGAEEFVFQPMNPAMRQEIGAALRVTFADAVKRNLEIAVLPQIDASGTITEWRNFFDFDPTAKLGIYSYESAMLDTILEALESVCPPDYPVEMTLEGEMGHTLFTHPDKWLGIMDRLRSRGKLKRLRLGISANYEGVSGKVKPDATRQLAMNALISSADFVGISCYAKTGNPPAVSDFTASVAHFCQEFADAGCPIPHRKPLRFTELGHGGGGFDADWKLTVPGPDPDKMGKAAYFGTDDLKKNPWTTPERIEFRRGFYRAALEFLSTQPAPWQVEQAYLWSYSSFDPQGIHMPEFADPQIAAAIKAHNTAVLSKPTK